MEIDGKICVISGGASGIGLGLAKALLARGGQVVLADINIARAEAVAEELGPKAHAAALDVRSTESFEALAAHAPYTPDAEKYNVQAIIRQLISEKD